MALIQKALIQLEKQCARWATSWGIGCQAPNPWKPLEI